MDQHRGVTNRADADKGSVLKTIRYRISAFTMRHRWLSLALLTAITAGFSLGLPRVELRTIFSDLLPANHPFVQTYQDLSLIHI